MLYGRDTHTVTGLPNGKVLIAGGNDGASPVIQAELYGPTVNNGESTLIGPVTVGGWRSAATVLSTGGVVLSGGYNYPISNCVAVSVNSVQLYSTTSNTFASLPSMLTPRGIHTSTLLSTNQMLVIGGFSQDSTGCGLGNTTFLASSEIIVP
jgi:hypothetical protein